jgi:hypothetical protein
MAKQIKLSEISDSPADRREELMVKVRGQDRLSVQEQLEQQAVENDAAARRKVETSPVIARIRGLKPKVLDASKRHRARVDAISRDAGLNATGKRERENEALRDFHGVLDGLVDVADEAFTDAEAAFVRPSPRFDPTDATDAARVQLAVTRAPQLTPREFLDELAGAIERDDRPLLAALRPLLASYVEYKKPYQERPFYRETNVLLDRSAGLLLTLGDAVSEYARGLLKQLRTDFSYLISAVADGGAWEPINDQIGVLRSFDVPADLAPDD